MPNSWRRNVPTLTAKSRPVSIPCSRARRIPLASAARECLDLAADSSARRGSRPCSTRLRGSGGPTRCAAPSSSCRHKPRPSSRPESTRSRSAPTFGAFGPGCATASAGAKPAAKTASATFVLLSEMLIGIGSIPSVGADRRRRFSLPTIIDRCCGGPTPALSRGGGGGRARGLRAVADEELDRPARGHRGALLHELPRRHRAHGRPEPEVAAARRRRAHRAEWEEGGPQAARRHDAARRRAAARARPSARALAAWLESELDRAAAAAPESRAARSRSTA